jgi:hypothetical protein
MMRTGWIIGCFTMLCLVAGSVQAQAIGTVVGLQGQAVIERDGAETALSLSAKVELNDRILTRSGAKLQILFDDDSVLALGENSEAVIDEYVYNPTEKKDNSFGARFGKGIFRLITGKITDLNPDRFKVKTARSSIGIRGCELGFLIDDNADRILLIRVPGGRQIIIGPAGQPLEDARVFPRAGRMITIFDDGRMQVEEIPPGEASGIFGGTTPGGGDDDNGDGEESDGAGDQPGDGAGDPPPPGLGENPGTEETQQEGPPQEPGNDPPATSGDPAKERDGALQERTLINETDDGENEAPLVRPTEGGEDQGNPPSSGQDGSAPSEPEPEPEELTINAANGLGGEYTGISEQYLVNEVTYSLNEGTIVHEEVNGELVSYANIKLNKTVTGANPGTEVIDLGRIELQNVDRSASYQGYSERTTTEGVRVANDSRGEFFRYINPGDSSQALIYGGVQDSTATLPANSLVKFEVESIELRPNSFDPNPAGTQPAILTWNTRTGVWLLEFDDDQARNGYGPGSMLQLFGSEAQGVGAVQPSAISGTLPGGLPSITDASYLNTEDIPGRAALAGFRTTAEPQAAPTGTRTINGYAAGIDQPPQGGPTIRYLSSANPLADTFAENEGRVQLTIDRDVMLNNVDVALQAAVDPSRSTPDPNDLQIGTPGASFYVRDDRFQTVQTDTAQPMEVNASDGGENWVWGEWAGVHEVDFGTGSLPQYTEGYWAAGDVISETVFQDIFKGAQSYNLQTPADRPGIAAAKAGDANNVTTLIGTANLQVNIPGNSATASWSGDFNNMIDGTGNSLNMSASGGFSTGGRLRGSASDFTLILGSQTKTASDGPLRNDVSGSLVGPGSAPRPITGVIGEGALDFSDGTKVRLVFGTDLVPGSVD